jgi:hypothetical protein
VIDAAALKMALTSQGHLRLVGSIRLRIVLLTLAPQRRHLVSNRCGLSRPPAACRCYPDLAELDERDWAEARQRHQLRHVSSLHFETTFRVQGRCETAKRMRLGVRWMLGDAWSRASVSLSIKDGAEVECGGHRFIIMQVQAQPLGYGSGCGGIVRYLGV